MLHRQAFWSLADQELRGVERAAVIVADLDHFKQINDDFGHKIGDDVLVAFSAAVRESIRSTDLVSRFGGEEFVLLLPGASVEAAQVIARSINRSLRDPELLPDGRPVTASYGVAPIDAHTTLVEAVNLADEALYAAKQAGRDRVVIAGQPVL
jgi:diguanylate cyclase (GGDEF)-like protein